MKLKKIIPKRINKFRKRIASLPPTSRVILISVVLLVLFFSTKNLLFGGSQEEYTFDTVEIATVTQQVRVNGNVSVPGAAEVFAPTDGILVEVFVKNGDRVSRGDSLFTVRSNATREEQATSLASYQSALNFLNTAQNAKLSLDATMWAKQLAYLNAQNEQNYKNSNTTNPATGRAYTNLEKQIIDSAVTQTQKDFLATERAYKTSDVAIADGQAQVNANYLSYQATQTTTVTAPVDGIIHNLVGLTGARVEGQNRTTPALTSTLAQVSQVQPAAPTPVLIIGKGANNYVIQTAVSEVYANKIKLGQRATIFFNGILNKIYKGSVVQLDTFGTNTQGVITYNVFVAIEDADSDLRPNMSAILTINAAERKDVLSAANGAIVTNEGKKAVQVLREDGEIEFIPVKVGLRGNTRTEIISGVDEGTEIIVGNTEFISRDGGSFSLGE